MNEGGFITKAILVLAWFALATLCISSAAQENTADYWMNKSTEFFNNGSMEESLNAMDKVLQIAPENESAWLNKADVLRYLGRENESAKVFESALEIINKTLEKNPQDASLWYGKGIALYFLGNEEEAVKANEKAWEVLNQSIEKDPKSARELVGNAHILPVQGRRIVDRIDYLFVDDPQLIGKWQGVDVVQRVEDFNPDSENIKEDLYLKELIFLKNGKIFNSPLSWTEGIIIGPVDKTASKYEIKEINGSTYMFFEWKSGDYSLRGMKPWFYVLKKIDSKDYSIEEVPKKEDKIDYPFVADPRILGKWVSVDFVKKPEDFTSGKVNSQDDLYLLDLEFSENGNVSANFVNRANESDVYTWTKDLVLSKRNKTASKYIIQEIDGGTYMFFQWKNGDYMLRNMEPKYYVLKKVS
ncbi:Tetratricopeptide repeat protein [uncultured archaeon]|nr:Tetratricopeptide repeat protein [uncultured archaeon]